MFERHVAPLEGARRVATIDCALSHTHVAVKCHSAAAAANNQQGGGGFGGGGGRGRDGGQRIRVIITKADIKETTTTKEEAAAAGGNGGGGGYNNDGGGRSRGRGRGRQHDNWGGKAASMQGGKPSAAQLPNGIRSCRATRTRSADRRVRRADAVLPARPTARSGSGAGAAILIV